MMPDEELVREEMGDSTYGEKYEFPPRCSAGDADLGGSCCVRSVRGGPLKPIGCFDVDARVIGGPISPVFDRDLRLVLEPLRLIWNSEWS